VAPTPQTGTGLAARITTAITERGLTVPQAARAIGVHINGLKRIVAVGADPNARTVRRYTRWLAQGDAPAAGSTPRPARASTAARRRRPTAQRTGRRTTGRQARTTISPSSALLDLSLRDLLAAAQKPAPALSRSDAAYLADALARRVHTARTSIRRIIATVLDHT